MLAKVGLTRQLLLMWWFGGVTPGILRLALAAGGARVKGRLRQWLLSWKLPRSFSCCQCSMERSLRLPRSWCNVWIVPRVKILRKSESVLADVSRCRVWWWVGFGLPQRMCGADHTKSTTIRRMRKIRREKHLRDHLLQRHQRHSRFFFSWLQAAVWRGLIAGLGVGHGHWLQHRLSPGLVTCSAMREAILEHQPTDTHGPHHPLRKSVQAAMLTRSSFGIPSARQRS